MCIPDWLYKKDRSSVLDDTCEFDHADLDRAKRSILWWGDWEKNTAQVVETLKSEGLLGPEKRVLDYGCGIGRITKAISPHVRHVAAVDRAPHMRTHAEAYLASEIVTGRCAVTAPQEHNAPVDLILLVEVAQHIPEPQLDELLVQLHTKLKPAGALFVWGNARLDVAVTGALGCTPVDVVLARHFTTLHRGTAPLIPADGERLPRLDLTRHWHHCVL